MVNEGREEDSPTEFQTEMECPSCGEKLFFIFYRTKINYEEAVEIETFFCKSCLYKSSQIKPLEEDTPKKLVLEVRNHADLRIILYRSPYATIQIPELDAEINPGEKSTGEITTIEGVITRLQEKIDIFDEEDADPSEITRLKNRINGILEGGSEAFTLVIDDPTGKSRINSSRVIVMRKSED